jgi:peptidyl-prolyl cis-trans isomerase SurA
MKCFAISLLLLCSVGLNLASAEVVSRVAAIVNKDIITTNQLDQKLQEQLAKQEREPSPAQLDAMRRAMLERMIEEKLVQQRIDALNLKVSEEELEAALLDVQQKNNLTREELTQAILVQGMDFDNYRNNLSQQILRYKLVGEEVRSKVDVTDREVAEYYRAHLDDYRKVPEVHLSVINFPIPPKASDQERQQILKIAGEALNRLQQNEEPSLVVASYREAYGVTSGDLGRFADNELIPEFANAIENVPAGGFGKPVVAADAIHLLRVEERLPGGPRQFDSVKNEISQMILEQKTEARLKEWTRAIKVKSYIDVRL